MIYVCKYRIGDIDYAVDGFFVIKEKEYNFLLEYLIPQKIGGNMLRIYVSDIDRLFFIT